MNYTLKMLVPVLALAAGCTAYSWKPSVPPELRRVAVTTFRNESDVTELGNLVTRQVLREFQREGTFAIASSETCALEIQGVMRRMAAEVVGYERKTGMRAREHRLMAEAVVSFINKKTGEVLVNDRVYKAQTSFLANDDILTAERDASGRLAEDFARQIVDDALAIK